MKPLIAIAFACLASTTLSAAPVGSADPLAAIDLNRNAIIADIVQGFEGEREALTKRLAALRADRLLSASLASTRESLESILTQAEKSRDAAVSRASAKALGSPTTDLVYTPLTPCRLIDTRGFGAPIQGGAYVGNARRNYAPAGLCALPTANVASILISFTTQNLTPNSGGYLAILAPAAPVTASVDVFNLGSEWSASNTAVITGPAAQFDVFVAVASAHVVIDVLGYFAAPQGGFLTGVTASAPLASSGSNTPNVSLTGIVPVANGGTGNATVPANGVLYGQGTNAIATAVGTTGQVFTGTAGAPAWSSSLALNANLTLVNSTPVAGNIFKNGVIFIHNSGPSNTFVGANAGNSAITGSGNTGTGTFALGGILAGFNNTAVGANALRDNDGGSSNTAGGVNSLRNNTSGTGNSAFGSFALASSTTTTGNSAVGSAALQNSVGSFNTAVGLGALGSNTTGDSNIALGRSAGANLTTGDFNISIGNLGIAGEASTTRIGATGEQSRVFIAGIRNTTTAGAAIPVLIDAAGQLGTTSSSRRFKDNIADMDRASSALMKLRPVTFNYKADRPTSERALEYGLIAEEVQEVYPGLVAHSADGQVETVMYQYLPAMMLNEMQKQQRLIEAQAAEISALKQAVRQIAGSAEGRRSVGNR